MFIDSIHTIWSSSVLEIGPKLSMRMTLGRPPGRLVNISITTMYVLCPGGYLNFLIITGRCFPEFKGDFEEYVRWMLLTYVPANKYTYS